MKKLPSYFLLFIASCLLIPTPISFSQGIQTGNSEANVTVETNIKGNGNVKTHIETSVNGEKKVLDETGPGTYKVEVKSGDKGDSSSLAPEASISPSQTSSAAPEIINKESNKRNEPAVLNLINNFKKSVEDFFKRIFNSLKLDKSF